MMRRLAAVAVFVAVIGAVACKSAPRAPAACRSDAACSSSEYCDFSPDLCGKGKAAGVCQRKPIACDGALVPVCACDGKRYPSVCDANAAGEDLAVMGGCKEPLAGFIPCGEHYCDVETSYCEIFLSDVFEIPSDYFCRPLPASCRARDGATPGCDCFPEGTRCLPFCGPLPTVPGGKTGFHLTCQGRRPPRE